MYVPHLKYSRLIIYDSNKAAVEIFAPHEKCMRPENRHPNSYYLGSAELNRTKGMIIFIDYCTAPRDT